MGTCTLTTSGRCATRDCHAWRWVEFFFFFFFFCLSCFSCFLHPCGGTKWSCQAFLTSGILIYMTSAALNVVHLSVSNGSMVNPESTQKKREALYLLGVGHYRSGDYSRSRQFVEKCLEVWFYIWVIHGFHPRSSPSFFFFFEWKDSGLLMGLWIYVFDPCCKNWFGMTCQSEEWLILDISKRKFRATLEMQSFLLERNCYLTYSDIHLFLKKFILLLRFDAFNCRDVESLGLMRANMGVVL